MIKKYLHKVLFFTVAFFCIANASIAQYASEDELKVAADKFFEEEKYVEALPLFSQLLSLYPKDVNYNYKYGASVLFGSRDKEDALKFLKFSVTKSTVDPIANYFLAKAYHHNYQFAPAQVYYNKFKEKASTKELQKYDIDNEIKMCKSGENLIKSMTDIGVLSKKEIKATDFFRSYELKGIGGKIIVKPDEFKTKLDKKNNESSIIYLGESKNTVVFSSYGNSGSTGKDIYKVVRLPNGEWSKPTPIGDGINTSLDEDYPFLHPNGRTLYFSSKGYNSMGGYDIFKSTLDANGNWSFPENLDFPINTPDDDILYISDIDNELAYFASSRESKQGELTVYNVTVDAPPVENSVVKGFFLAESNPSMKSATITIRDVEKDRRYGVYKTHQETGEYLLVFPSNGGKFKILVETTGSAPIHSAVIELPVLDGFRALKQELRLVGEGDSEKLVVKNLFDESDEFDIHDPLVVEHILKQRAKLEVNITKDELQNKSKNAVIASNETESNKYAKLSNAQVANAANETSTKIIEQTEKSQTQANTSYGFANQKSAKAKALYNESEKLLTEAKNSTSESEKQQKIALAESKKMEAAKLINETVAALNIARTLDNELTERKSDVATVKALQEKINTNIDEENRSEAENNLAKLDEIAAATYHNESALVAEEKLLNDKLEEKKATYNKARDKVTELVNREYELKAKADNLEEQKKSTKKKSEIADLDAQIKLLAIDVEDNELALSNAKTKAASTKKEYTNAVNEVETYKNIISNVIEGTNKTSVSASSKLQLENDVKYFEKEGMVGVYPTDEVKSTNVISSETYSLVEHKNEYKIISEDGKLIDYNTTFSTELSKLDEVKDPTAKTKQLMKINQSWIENIDEEIKLRNEQLKVETNPATKTDLQDKVTSLQSLKAAKLKEIKDNEVILANNTTSLNNNTTTSTNVVANNVEVNIMSAEGTIIDYSTNYTEKLSTYTQEDTYDTYKEKAAIHSDWASATEQEILIRKMELAEANEDEKNDIQNKIAILENNLTEQNEFIALYDAQAESIKPIDLATNTTINNETNTNSTPTNNTTSNETNSNESSNNEVNTNKAIDLSQFKVVNTDGTVKDYSSNYQNKIIAANSQTNIYSKNIEQSNLTKEWINSIDEEIKYRKEQLKYVDDSQKDEINSTILTLENNKKTQQTNYNNYQNSALAEKKKNEEANLTANNLNDEQDEFSNLKYNNSFDYKSELSKNSIVTVTPIKEEAKRLKEEAEIALNLASNASSEDDKNELLRKSENLTDQSNRKQEEVAAIVENANRSEFYNNQAVISNLKKENTDAYANNNLMAELFVEEAENYYEQAKEARLKAVNTPNVTAKQASLQKAYELEMKAIEKQNKAIEQLANGKNTEVIYSSVESNTNVTNNNASNNEVNSNEIALNESNTNETNATNNTNEANNETASNESNTNENETNSNTINNNEVSSNETTSNESNTNSNETNSSENQTNSNSANSRTGDQITEEDKKVIANLGAKEITAVKNSEEFKNYAELKQENRRLVKEAEVEYIEAKVIEQDIVDQNTLGSTLQAMADNASSEEDKAKKVAQIKKLNEMIAANEKKASTLKQSAAAKEEKASSAEEKSNAILINANEKEAKTIVAIEKAESFDKNLITEAMSRTTNSNETASNESNTNANEINNEVTSNENNTNENSSNVTNNEATSNENERNTNTTNNNESNNEAISNETSSNETNLNESTNNENSTNETNNDVNSNETASNENNTNEATNQNNLNESAANNSTEVSTNIDEIPTVLNKSIFLINNNNQSIYNNNKKIPTAAKMPEGLVFKVQIGAFRNEIPQDHFKGFAPIMAEDAGNGITRYTAGLFNAFNVANEAKNSIRSIGYGDAFVVAFLNGKRININEARAMVNEANTSAENNFAVNENTNESNTTTTNNTENNSTRTTNNASTESNQTEEVKDGVSTDVRNIDGIFYTIQVGVYSKQVTAGQLNNVSPINSERTASGLIRYTSGVYKTLTDANAAKDRIRGLGITDAFVIAYNKGTKITVTQANELLNSTGSNITNNVEETPVEETPVEETPVEETPVEETPVEETPVEETPVEETPVEETPVEENVLNIKKDLNLEFKVKLGEYEQDVPVDEAGIYLKLTSRGIKNYEQDNKTIYTLGSFKEYQKALDLQIEMKEMGVKNPKTMVLRDGTEIPLEEALELMKNNK